MLTKMSSGNKYFSACVRRGDSLDPGAGQTFKLVIKRFTFCGLGYLKIIFNLMEESGVLRILT
jgi:hypothetical protein